MTLVRHRSSLAKLTALVLCGALVWLFITLRPVGNSGSLDARAAAVEAQVRCPVCPEPIPVSDVQNLQAAQMREYIRSELRRGVSEDGVLRELADGYGPSILLAPPQSGFDALAWLVPIAVVGSVALVLAVTLRRWSRDPERLVRLGDQGSLEREHYEELLDRELARWE